MTDNNSISPTENHPLNSQRQIALISGFSLLGLAIVIIIAQGITMGSILVDGNPGLSIENILSQPNRFRLMIFLHLVAVILDLVVAWALFIFLKPAKDDLSLLAAWARIAYTIFFGFAIVTLYGVFQLLGDGAYLNAFTSTEIEAKVALQLAGFKDIWNVGYLFFGLHLALLGIVSYRSGFLPKFLGILLVVGGVSYLLDYSSMILFPNLGLETSLVFGWGELIFMFWLLFRGGKQKPRLRSEIVV
jgi:hypothetical protein